MRLVRPVAVTVLTGLLAAIAPGLPALADTAPVASPSGAPSLPLSNDGGAPGEQAGHSTPAPGQQRYVVTFAKDTAPREGAEVIRDRGGEVHDVLRHVFPGAVTELTPHQAAALARNPHVEQIQPDLTATIAESQSNPTWGLDRVDQRQLPLSSSFTTGTNGAGVTAYVIDTGVVGGHPEFEGRVTAGVSTLGDGGVGASDCNGHGTHVAGTIGGKRYGVAEDVTLVPIRALGCDGSGSYSQILAGIDWMIGHHAAGTPAVANLSLGGPAADYLDAAVDKAVADGITMVVAAGNANVDACTTSPGRAPAALTVGATNSTDMRASFSNYGSCLDLFAPGVGITSAHPSGTASMSGTSMAAPHVAGAAAALLESAPSLSPAQVAATLTRSATEGVVLGAGAGSPTRLLWADPKLTPYVAPSPAPSQPVSSEPSQPAPAPAPSEPTPAPSKPAPAPSEPAPAPSQPEQPTEEPTTPTEPEEPIAPETELVQAPADGEVVLRRSVRIRYDASNADDFVCTLDGAPRPCGDGSVRLRGLTPGTHVFTVAARTATSGIDASAESVTFVIPRNNTDLRRSRAWDERRGRGYYLRSFTTTSRRGATLSARVSDVRDIALIATAGAGHGRVKVYLGKQLLDRISLSASRLDKRRVISVANLDRSVSGRIRIVVVSRGRPVRIEGLALGNR